MTTVTISLDLQYNMADANGTRVVPQLNYEFYRNVKINMT